MTLFTTEHVKPNDRMRVVGHAYIGEHQSNPAYSVGKVLETSDKHKLLWMLAYPLQTGKATIAFTEDQGYQDFPISVVINTRTFEKEFDIGHIRYFGKQAQLNFYAIPTFFSNLLIGTPTHGANSLKKSKTGSSITYYHKISQKTLS